ncbi:hypothetical protein GCM10011390_21420 [Aureimonas endophytica]|uniref:Uncharacterized protein n=1 Tax=Aureimonas endophytica TaxID=2027858 RepID=A0A916ZKJ3_9HYPH|nr:hypothetical protein GCM10011390_21420 [Aureimonas endophytica]
MDKTGVSAAPAEAACAMAAAGKTVAAAQAEALAISSRRFIVNSGNLVMAIPFRRSFGDVGGAPGVAARAEGAAAGAEARANRPSDPVYN